MFYRSRHEQRERDSNIDRQINSTRNTFCGTWYRPHSRVHNDRTVPMVGRNKSNFIGGLYMYIVQTNIVQQRAATYRSFQKKKRHTWLRFFTKLSTWRIGDWQTEAERFSATFNTDVINNNWLFRHSVSRYDVTWRCENDVTLWSGLKFDTNIRLSSVRCLAVRVTARYARVGQTCIANVTFRMLNECSPP